MPRPSSAQPPAHPNTRQWSTNAKSTGTKKESKKLQSSSPVGYIPSDADIELARIADEQLNAPTLYTELQSAFQMGQGQRSPTATTTGSTCSYPSPASSSPIGGNSPKGSRSTSFSSRSVGSNPPLLPGDPLGGSLPLSAPHGSRPANPFTTSASPLVASAFERGFREALEAAGVSMAQPDLGLGRHEGGGLGPLAKAVLAGIDLEDGAGAEGWDASGGADPPAAKGGLSIETGNRLHEYSTGPLTSPAELAGGAGWASGAGRDGSGGAGVGGAGAGAGRSGRDLQGLSVAHKSVRDAVALRRMQGRPCSLGEVSLAAFEASYQNALRATMRGNNAGGGGAGAGSTNGDDDEIVPVAVAAAALPHLDAKTAQAVACLFVQGRFSFCTDPALPDGENDLDGTPGAEGEVDGPLSASTRYKSLLGAAWAPYSSVPMDVGDDGEDSGVSRSMRRIRSAMYEATMGTTHVAGVGGDRAGGSSSGGGEGDESKKKLAANLDGNSIAAKALAAFQASFDDTLSKASKARVQVAERVHSHERWQQASKLTRNALKFSGIGGGGSPDRDKGGGRGGWNRSWSARQRRHCPCRPGSTTRRDLRGMGPVDKAT
eukprot:jgi/Mesvir1/23727/Mv18671-RA.1